MKNYRVKITQYFLATPTVYITAQNACEAVEIGFQDGSIIRPQENEPFQALVTDDSGFTFRFDMIITD